MTRVAPRQDDAPTGALEQAQAHREAVTHAIERVEAALRVGDTVDIEGAAERLVDLVFEHVDLAEAPDGVIADVMARAPRLAHATRSLEDEHRELEALAQGLLAAAHEELDAGTPQVRDAAQELVERLQAHRRKGATLLFDAYELDIGGGD